MYNTTITNEAFVILVSKKIYFIENITLLK